MVLPMDRLFANDHPERPASCKCLSGWTGLLQIIIRTDRPLANDHPDQPYSSPFFFLFFSKFIIFPQQTSSSPSNNFLFFFKSWGQDSILRTYLEQYVLVFYLHTDRKLYSMVLQYGAHLFMLSYQVTNEIQIIHFLFQRTIKLINWDVKQLCAVLDL